MSKEIKDPELEIVEEKKEKQRLIAQAKKEREKYLKKQANQPKPKYYYDVKVECMLPAVLTYRILAETPEQAAELIRGQQPNSVQHKLIGRKEMVLRVFDASSTMIRFMKKLFGG